MDGGGGRVEDSGLLYCIRFLSCIFSCCIFLSSSSRLLLSFSVYSHSEDRKKKSYE